MSLRALQAAALGAATFGVAAWVEHVGAAGIARLAIRGAALAAAAAFDLSERRIPNLVTIPAALALFVLWAASGATPGRVAAGLAVAGVLLVTGLLRPDAIGMGDAKLALVVALGLMDKALIGLACGLLLAAIFGAARLAARSGGRKSAIPLGPFLALGALIALVA
jgi:leader peptidase (prepilin peptidase)/N-methyltransferase